MKSAKMWLSLFWIGLVIPIMCCAMGIIPPPTNTTYVCLEGDGSDVYSGNCSTAYGSFADIDWENILPGATIYVLDDNGPFSEMLKLYRSGTPNNPITVVGDGDGNPEFADCDWLCLSVSNQKYINISNIEIDGSARTGIHRVDDAQSWEEADNTYINISNVKISNTSGNGIFMAGHHITIADSELTYNGNDEQSRFHNVYVIGDNTRIENSDLSYSVNGCGLRMYGSHLDIIGNMIGYNGKRPICVQLDTNNFVHSDWDIVDNVIVTTMNDYFIMFQNGEATSTYSDIKIDDNIFYNPTIGASGFFINDMNNFTFTNNQVQIDNYGLGFICPSCANGAVVDYNSYHKTDFMYNNGITYNPTEWQAAGWDIHSTLTEDDMVEGK